jgi:enoyl-[acyl-carrier protein] reductase I
MTTGGANLLEHKRGVILGVANKRSLAWAIARACAARGARLALTYQGPRFESGVRDLAATLPHGGDVLVLPCDVTNGYEIDALASAVKKKWHGVDFVVHSIAYANPDELRAGFRDTSREGFRVALDVSAYSVVPVARAFAPLMAGGGSVVALSYLGGERVVPNYNLMGVAKAALDCAVRYLAADLGPQGVRVNCVSPGPVRTISAAAISDFNRMLDHVEKAAPLRRNVTPEEVGDTVAFMVSDMSRAITGQQIHVDCGYSAMGVTMTADSGGGQA